MRAGETRSKRGFTLTELIVVIAIIMTLAGAAVPALAAFRRAQRLDHSARLVQSKLDDARRAAITRRARHVVVFYSFQETPGELDTIRHAIRIYQEPTGVKAGPNIPKKVSDGYFAGGYVGRTLVLPSGVRFQQTDMECRLLAALPDEKDDIFRRKLIGEQSEALAIRRDGSFEERRDASPNKGSRNIFMPDEGYYQVTTGTRADIVLVETDTNGSEVRSKGKTRRALIDLNAATGRVVARVFDIGATDEFTTGGGR